MFREENKRIEEYIQFLGDKGKITKIKDTGKNICIKFSTGIVYYFLLVVFILISILTIFLIINRQSIFEDDDLFSSLIIIGGSALFSIILFFVVKNEKEKLKLDVVYLNDDEMKINNSVYNIQKDECYIEIRRKNETYYTGHSLDYTNKVINYYLIIARGRREKKLLIVPGTEEQISDFIYNFDFEISDFKKKKQDIINQLQEQYNSLKEDENE